jgi:hypothetical protein
MKRLFITVLTVSLFVIVVCAAGPANAKDAAGVNIGILTCTAVPGSGYNYLITSSVDVECEFTDPTGQTEYYIGETGIGLGVNLNFKAKETIGFTVFAVSKDYKIGSHGLAGKYGGAKASATVGVGVGAAVLVGGGAGFSLQPLALEGNTGFGAAAGLGYLYLQAK